MTRPDDALVQAVKKAIQATRVRWGFKITPHTTWDEMDDATARAAIAAVEAWKEGR